MATKKKVVKKVEENIPECVDRNIIDAAPLWAKYYAVDGNGVGYYYEEEPSYDEHADENEYFEWSSDGEKARKAPKVFTAKQSLVLIPENNNFRKVLNGEVSPSKEDLDSLIKFAKKYLNLEDEE